MCVCSTNCSARINESSFAKSRQKTPKKLKQKSQKTYNFQEKQKRNFLAGQTKRLAALDAKHREFLRQKEERIAAIEKSKMRLAQLHRDIAEKKEHHRNGDPRQWSGRDRPLSHSSLYNPFPNEHQHCDFFQTPKKRQDETYGVNEGGFLQLKTPGVFHGEKDDRPRVKDPVKKRSKTSATGDHIFERLDNSSEKPLREKIKMRQRNKKYHSFFSPDYNKYDPNNPQRYYKY